MTQTLQEGSQSGINQEVTADMVRQLITLLQQMLDVSGKGRMSEQFQEMILELNAARKAMDKLTRSLDAITAQNHRLDRIERTLNFIADSLVEPQPETK